jgi:hypothetical protein
MGYLNIRYLFGRMFQQMAHEFSGGLPMGQAAKRVCGIDLPEITVNGIQTVQRMSQETAIENDDIPDRRSRVAKMMAGHSLDAWMVLEESRQIAPIERRIGRRAVDSGEPSGKFALQDEFQSGTRVFKYVIVHYHKTLLGRD